jgi:ABC-type glutathione transport system ATPase component
MSRAASAPDPAGRAGDPLPRRRAIEPIPPDAVPVMEAVNISKAFGATTALIDVSLKAYAGRILALLGDNGAGKSTLIKILSGVFRRSSVSWRTGEVQESRAGAPTRNRHRVSGPRGLRIAIGDAQRRARA